jgi:hypothetical protein
MPGHVFGERVDDHGVRRTAAVAHDDQRYLD